MGRSVSSPSGAIVAFTVLEVENDDDWDFGLVTVLCRSPISLSHLGFEGERADSA